MSIGPSERAALGRPAGLVEAFIEYAPIGFALLDREMRFVQVNERMAEINGVPVAAHVGRRPQEVVPGLPVESYLEVVERALAGVPTEAIELSGQTPRDPGVTRWWLETWSPVRGSSGEIIGAAAFVVEITDRRRAEAQLRDAESRDLAQAEALARLAAEAARTVTVAELAAVVANCAPQTVEAAFANVALIVPPGDRLRVFHGQALDDSIAERWREVSTAARVPLSEAILTATPVFVHSPQENARRFPCLAADTARAGLAATASLPLLDRAGGAIGAIGFAWRVPRDFPAALRARLQTVAELAAQSLERATLYEAERLAHERVSLAADATDAMSHAAPLADRMTRLCAVLTPRFADVAIAELRGQHGLPAPLAIAHREPAALARLRTRLAADTPQTIARLPTVGAPQYLPDVAEAVRRGEIRDRRTRELLEAIEPRTYLGVALRAGNRVVGTLALAHTTSGRFFTIDDVAFVAQLGERAGLVLDNARLVEAEHEIARELQQRLLPSSLPVPSSVGVAARYQPAHAQLGVGGDWYDVAELADGRLAVAVGDIVGHGARAAATMGQLRSAFAALAPAAAGPADLLDRFDTFSERTPDAACSSVCSALLDPAEGTLRYACAGHPPPLVLHPDGTTRLLEQGASSLISLSDAPRPEAETTLPAGARLLLYTDGLIERRRTSIDAGLRRLAEVTSRHRGSHLEGFCDALIAELLADEATIDDVALLCVELLRASD